MKLYRQNGIIPANKRPYYHKWLRFYLDFCHKSCLEPSEKRNFPAFDEKLSMKNQREQAKLADRDREQ
jgi:hypothetical protein